MRIGLPAVALTAMALTGARDADACGGCFHREMDTSGSVVTDHRMLFEITSQETILRDQVRYAGDPCDVTALRPACAAVRARPQTPSYSNFCPAKGAADGCTYRAAPVKASAPGCSSV